MSPAEEDDDPWLREMVDDDLLPLFADDEATHRRGARRLLRELGEDSDVETRLIDLLETALDRGNDDTLASVLIAYILGEARSTRAIGVLLRAMSSDDDEVLQDAAQVALLRIGSPALTAAMDRLEEDESPVYCRAAYQLLGLVGSLEDRGLVETISSFLTERIAAERQRPRSESVIEHVCRAVAQIGDHRSLPLLREILAQDFRGRQPTIRDACEQLEENPLGEPFMPTVAPWEERYGWLLADEESPGTRRRGQRQPTAEAADDEPDEAEEAEAEDEPESSRSRQSRLLWGLNAFVGDSDEEEGLDARRYLDRPGAQEDD